MKRIFLLAGLVTLSWTSLAQAPQGINYQAVIRNSAGTILSNSNVGLKISLIQTSPTGTVVYEESFSPTTSNYGLVNVIVGQGTVISGDFSTIDWANGPYFVELASDATGGTNYTVMGTQQLMSVPYALYAENSGTPGPTGPQGPAGNDGANGTDGLSAYEVWLSLGNTGSQADFINSLEGPQGATGPQGPAGNDGVNGAPGAQGPAGNDGVNGVDGQSAYELWLAQGNTGSQTDFLNSLQGAQGPQGIPGNDGSNGVDGAPGAAGPQGPAGNDGSNGSDGADGQSAYELWLAQGNTGSETDFLNALVGAQGPQGIPGNDGADGATGPQGPPGANGTDGIDGAPGAQGPAGNDGSNGSDGADGQSAYELWLAQGNTGSETDFLNSLVGAQGPQGIPGNDGVAGTPGAQGPAGNDGADGATGPQGNPGNDGADGQSAYQVWLGLGNTGSETDFINSLQGPQGVPGNDGATGAQGPTGPAGPAGPQGPAGTNGVAINWLGSMATAPVSPNTNDGYYNSTVGISYVWTGSSWQIVSQDASVAGSSTDDAKSLIYTVDGF